MAVRVEKCGRWRLCRRCWRWARLATLDGDTRQAYCPKHLRRRIWSIQQRNQAVEVSRSARRILDKAGV